MLLCQELLIKLMFYSTIPITRELDNLANQQGFSIITNIGHYTSSWLVFF